MLTDAEMELVEWYRTMYKDKELPCKKCSDEKIISCMHAKNTGACMEFKAYCDVGKNKKKGWLKEYTQHHEDQHPSPSAGEK